MESKDLRWKNPLIWANFLFVCSIYIAFLFLQYPYMGTDYGLTYPSMLDTSLYFRLNGLSIQWYTPTFGGGVPAYPNPNNVQFSLPSLLTVFFTPSLSVIITIIVFVGMGFFSSYYIFSSLLKLNWTSSILGAVFFSANGYMMERVGIGHLYYTSMPLVAFFLLLLLDQSLSVNIVRILFSMGIALLLHMGGHFIVIISIFSIAICLPLIYLYKPDAISIKRTFLIVISGGCLSLLISASKLSAVYSFMRYFPRTISAEYTNNILLAIFGIIFQLLGTMSIAPLRMLVGLDPATLPINIQNLIRLPYGYWEFDMSMSPVVFILIFIGIDMLFHRIRNLSNFFIDQKKWIALIVLIISTWLTTEFILANGLVYPALRHLPILSSLHVNYRLTAVFLFPLAFCATITYNTIVTKIRWNIFIPFTIIVNLLTLAPLGFYFIEGYDFTLRTYNLENSNFIHQSILAGNKFEITRIDKNQNNTLALLNGASNLNLYDPIFGYELEYFHPEVHSGSVWDASEGYLNMTNPAGYVFPAENNTRAFEQIHVEDKSNLKSFVQYRRTEWKLPLYQRIANWVSELTFLFSLGCIGLYQIQALQNKPPH